MKLISLVFLSIFFFNLITVSTTIDLKGLQFLINIITGEFMESRLRSKDDTDSNGATEPIIGYTNYTFHNILSDINGTGTCLLGDKEKELTSKAYDKERSEKKVKCRVGFGNGTLQIINSFKEVDSILAPYGNSTKRNQPGNCALILFYAKSCPGSAMVAPHFNSIVRQFPDIKMVAIDALKYYILNSEFGIFGLPTIVLVHQGRNIMKFNDNVYSIYHFIEFIKKYTDIQETATIAYVKSEDFYGPLSSHIIQKETDYCLYLAWLFIIVCAIYYFTKSKFYTQIVEMIKLNWRESEAHHEHGS